MPNKLFLPKKMQGGDSLDTCSIAKAGSMIREVKVGLGNEKEIMGHALIASIECAITKNACELQRCGRLPK